MRKLILASVLTAALGLASQEQASAWSNIKFGAGVNLHWQTGDNNLLWGLFRNGQIPHPAGYPGYAAPLHPYHGIPHHPGAHPSEGSNSAATRGAPGTLPTQFNNVRHPSSNNNPYHYQPVGYSPYQAPGYYPSYNPHVQVPSYWYGR